MSDTRVAKILEIDAGNVVNVDPHPNVLAVACKISDLRTDGVIKQF